MSSNDKQRNLSLRFEGVQCSVISTIMVKVNTRLRSEVFSKEQEGKPKDGIDRLQKS